VYDTAI